MPARAQLPVAAVVSRWASDAWSLGAWSVVRPGGLEARRAMAAPFAPRVRLAGEAVHLDHPATLHGAWASGEQAALELAAHLTAGDRVAVVGAGAAGVAAARTLRQHGMEPFVLEARNRLGGRVHTVDLGDGIQADLGAAFLQEHGRNALARVAEESGTPTVAVDLSHPSVATPTGPVPDVARVLSLARTAVAALRPGEDPSLGAVLRAVAARSALTYPAVRNAVEGPLVLECGVEPDEVSARATFAEPGIGEGDHVVPSGLQGLLTKLAAGLDVRLGQPVSAIHHTDTGVTTEGPEGRQRAAAAVVTVPVEVLRRGHLCFHPPPPAGVVAAWDALPLGRVEKVLLRYPERWWPPFGTHLWWIDRPALTWGEWFDLTDVLGAPVLALLAGARAADRLHGTRATAQVVADAHDAAVRYARSR